MPPPTTQPPTAQPPAGAAVPEPHPEAPGPGAALPSHFARCFGCGPEHPTGLHLDLRAAEGVAVTADLTVTGDHQGAPGLAHGGLLAAAFDEALAGLLHRLRLPAVTARLETDFLAPVPVGSRLWITARCAGTEGRKVYGEAEGRLGGPAGPIAVRASGLFVVVEKEHFDRHRQGAGDSGASYSP